MGDITVTPEEFLSDPRVDEFIRQQAMEQLGMDEGEEMAVTIDCPYAQYVEFGSDPADPDKASFNKRKDPKDPTSDELVTETRIRLRDWAADKFGLNPEERVKRGDMLYKKIMEEGMQATPFIRPAIYNISMDINEHPEKYLTPEKGKTFYEHVANELAGAMARALIQHNSVVTGDLLKSIRVVPYSEVEGHEPPEDLKAIKSEVWDDMNLDRHGNWIKPR